MAIKATHGVHFHNNRDLLQPSHELFYDLLADFAEEEQGRQTASYRSEQLEMYTYLRRTLNIHIVEIPSETEVTYQVCSQDASSEKLTFMSANDLFSQSIAPIDSLLESPLEKEVVSFDLERARAAPEELENSPRGQQRSRLGQQFLDLLRSDKNQALIPLQSSIIV